MKTNKITKKQIQALAEDITIENIVAIANKVKKIIDKQRLFVEIKGQKYVYCRGWKLLANRLGFIPEIVELTPIKDEIKQEIVDGKTFTRRMYKVQAVAQLRSRINDKTYSRAMASCSNWEKNGAYGEDFAVEGMAMTRAIARSCKNALDWIMTLAGYSELPYEERDEKFEEKIKRTEKQLLIEDIEK